MNFGLPNDMKFKKYTWDLVDSNSYLFTIGSKGLLIDAVFSTELIEDLSNLSELKIIITHSHFDHIISLNRIRDLFSNVEVISTKKCSDNIGNIYSNLSSVANVYLSFYLKESINDSVIEPFTCSKSDVVFEDEMEFDWNGIRVQTHSCYGHSNDSLIVLIDNRLMFSGDSLLLTPTITRFMGGSKKCFLEEDIPYFYSLISDVGCVFPGHGENGQLKTMIDSNVKYYNWFCK